jgi:hypothetical protein
MSARTSGVVKQGVIVPNAPLPEGAWVEIQVCETLADVPDELRAEFEAWDRASAQALDLVERLAAQDQPDDAR